MTHPHSTARWLFASGLFNAWIWAAVAWALCGGLGGWSTAWIGRVGGLCGWSACLLAPVGWAEIGVALWVRSETDPVRATRWMRRFAWVQVATVLLGGVPSLVAGLAVLRETTGSRPRA